MYSTRQVVELLRRANPRAGLSESRVRNVLRRQSIPSIRIIAGRLVWARADVNQLARLLDVEPPFPDIPVEPEHQIEPSAHPVSA